MRSLRLILLKLVLTFSCAQAQFNGTDVLHYAIRLTEVNLTSKTIHAATSLSCKVQAGSSDTIHTSLLKLTIDSIISSTGSALSYTYNDTTLSVTLPSGSVVGDTINYTVFYRGSPQGDPAGWGGFRFSGNHAFNMGVGFGTNPHNLGRVWFPCNDNFTDRATYSFEVVTDAGSKAFCNGILVSDSSLPNNKHVWNWELNQSIPTYLASVAIAPYTTWRDTCQNIPVEIACLASDTAKVSGTFVHLDSVMHHFIDAYGPYRFDKIGYCLVPFNSGAMEHASSIHIGRTYINGQLTYESLWVHELAHMWWGDWVTCESEGEMWLNEGFASFNEGFIAQQLYGDSAYKDWFRSNHRPVLQFAHITDNAYLPLINIPHEHTYGPTVYNKGADVAHTLRFYMGDSLFFEGCKAYFDSLGDGHAGSEAFRDVLEQSSGMSLDRFFEDWVFTPGFPHFTVDSVIQDSQTANRYRIYTRQRSKGNLHVYSMPVEWYAGNGNSDTSIVLQIDSITQEFIVDLPFNPTWWSLDRSDRMADASIAFERNIAQAGLYDMPETNTTMNVLQAPTPALLRTIHHFVAPDEIKTNTTGIRISDYHYWSVEGMLPAGFSAVLRLIYNGSNSTSVGYLDNTLITGTEDSLVLLFRSGAEADWQVVTACSLAAGNKFDKIGSFYVDSLKCGEYALGYRDGTTGFAPSIERNRPSLKIWPNPASEEIQLTLETADHRSADVSVCDLSGREVAYIQLSSGTIHSWKPTDPGTYLFTLMRDKYRFESQIVQFIR
ncbi:MAG: M1 family aminopeptidase [Bacteroidota bacterium]|jgi:hypothetical protein